MIKDNQRNKHGEELFSLTMDMDTTRRIQVLAIIGLFGIAFLWMYGLSQTSAPDIPTIYATAAVPAPQPDQKKVILKNLGMSCVFCKAAVSAKLKQVPGLIAYDVDVKSDSATVLYDPAKVTIEKLKQAIAEAGFQVRAVEEVSK